MTTNILVAKGLTKIYGEKHQKIKAVNDLWFEIKSGEFVGIMGASGSGKSTILNILSTIDTPTSGDIIIDNHHLSQMTSTQLAKFRGEKIGFIFQEFNLLENLTAYENISIPLSLKGMAPHLINDQIIEVAKLLNIESELPKYPTELSGGQKQRVASARALINKPSILLGDEPTGALDSKNAKELLSKMSDINKESKVTILMVTHDALSASYCHRILFVKDGRLEKEINRGQATQTDFYKKVIRTIASLEGVES